MQRPSDLPRKKVAPKYWVRDFGDNGPFNRQRYNYKAACAKADEIGVLGAVYKDGTCTHPIYSGEVK